MKRWMKPDWVIFQWKFSGFCKNPVDLVQLVGTFFLVCPLSDNRQAIDQCLIWNPITLQGEQTMSLVCQSIWIHPSKTRFYKSLGQFQPTSRVQNIAVSHITILQFILLLDNFSGCRTVDFEEIWMHFNYPRCSFQPFCHPCLKPDTIHNFEGPPWLQKQSKWKYWNTFLCLLQVISFFCNFGQKLRVLVERPLVVSSRRWKALEGGALLCGREQIVSRS